MALQRHPCIAILFAQAIIATFDATSGLRYTVGGSVWSIPPHPDFYYNWSSSHTFYIGDVLVFDFEYEFFNAIQVPRLDYESCTALNPMRILTRSPAVAILIHEGVNYYICNISNYCDLGLRFSVVVHKFYYSTGHSPVPPPTLSPYPAPGPSQAGWTDVSQPSVPNNSPIAPNAGRRKGLRANSGGTVVGLACALCLGTLFVLL
ncbi:PREDICTED: chemocyanin-like [Populus euphratica]|uniref:Chemocyanin-like n=1 Tax=Populus euphratica TaxID=75702 RepID=A0AAJ6U899_POPEU|nr:PREDICTED: chemocyanin-like [Populus euphratica]